METLKSSVVWPDPWLLFSYRFNLEIVNEITLKTDVLLFQTCYDVVA